MYIFSFLPGRLDPAVRWNHEGKHQRQDCVWLLRLCQHLRPGFSHEEVRFYTYSNNVWTLLVDMFTNMAAYTSILSCRCLEWLLNNLMTHQNVDLMKEIGYAFCMEKENLDYSNICIFFRLLSVSHFLTNPSSVHWSDCPVVCAFIVKPIGYSLILL